MDGRVLYPATDFTTGDLAQVYEELAPVLLPHLAEHPLTLKRFPNDIHGESFWEKDAPNFTPDWIERLQVPRKRANSPINYISLSTVEGLLWAASIGCIEIHSFLHRYPFISSPTVIAFDLDPGPGMNVIDCCSVALNVRAWFRKWGLECFSKVSGSKGIQVYVPLNTPSSYAVTEMISRRVAQELEQSQPHRIISRMERSARSGKVFIDWSQNMEHKTTVNVYSVRANAERPYISMPLTWDEVEKGARRGRAEDLKFTPDEAITRVRQVGDLFEQVLKLKQTLPKRMIDEFGLPPVPMSRPVQVREVQDPTPRLPRSSGQGGRRLFVVHRKGSTYEFSIEWNEVFQSYALRKIPARPGETTPAASEQAHSLGYLTEESPESGIVWDLGTYEIVEGSFETSGVEIFLSGRRLNGAWKLILDQGRWRLANGGGEIVRALRGSESVLTGKSDLEAGRAKRGS